MRYHVRQVLFRFDRERKGELVRFRFRFKSKSVLEEFSRPFEMLLWIEERTREGTYAAALTFSLRVR